jgi:hypothetical protein
MLRCLKYDTVLIMCVKQFLEIKEQSKTFSHHILVFQHHYGLPRILGEMFYKLLLRFCSNRLFYLRPSSVHFSQPVLFVLLNINNYVFFPETPSVVLGSLDKPFDLINSNGTLSDPDFL